ncbi:hypothetical protein ZOD2009_17960 [Haladaptatus paucihalophilus DX253]|uniref:Uncharacterized protein n=1 Tax=Haladaptatus paucihalophilus DX253 TaxID=797209 RepID=E7QXQ3_HALPU|nr:hypothetical protein ZOD2009_17960 [Haladaptatus paucihalophilus DX253]GKZ14868.1 hypothetical protein HAL_27490 [Haladaptatus sp. T7]
MFDGEFQGVLGGGFDCTFERRSGVRGGREERHGLAVGVVPATREFSDDSSRGFEWHISSETRIGKKASEPTQKVDNAGKIT